MIFRRQFGFVWRLVILNWEMTDVWKKMKSTTVYVKNFIVIITIRTP
jgi:hypothetical protein